ncbi:MAG: ketohexokinase [Methylophagaceae bacterium]|jgi:ketohexokinase
MTTVLAVGIATLDIINVVERYPSEDSETRAISQHKTRGGNATNTLIVLSQLGHQSHWAGVLIDESDSQTITRNLAKHNIDTSACKTLPVGKMPTSYITLNKINASRTIVHYRDSPEYDFASFKKIDLNLVDWVHFEGRNIEETKDMLIHLKQAYPELPCSVEVEKSRQGIESLFCLPDWIFFSKDYAISQGHPNAITFLKQLSQSISVQATCTWGERGAWLITKNKTITHQNTHHTVAVLDTLGAGDTFNAGFIHGQLKKLAPQECLSYATQLASHKCTQLGLESINRDLTIKN